MDVSLLAVRGWQQSKASTNEDGGVSSLRNFLAKKASRPISEIQVQGDALMIAVKATDEHRFTHLNGFVWAGVTLSVSPATPQASSHPKKQTQPSRGPRNNSPKTSQPSSANNNQNQRARSGNTTMSSSPFTQTKSIQTQEQNAVTQIMASVIQRRYNPSQKYLTFESLASEPQFVQAGLTAQPAAKVFAAVFVTCENDVFETPAKRRDMVESLSLANNGLTTAKDVIAAASTFANIKNLDLSNNNIPEIGELRYWRNRFRNLEHIILSGNPVALKPETRGTLKRWYPKLRLYNNEPVLGQDNPAPSSAEGRSPVYPLPTEVHPEFGPDSTFGVPQPDKSAEQLLKEQMGLKFSYETRLKMQYVEECLTASGFNYEAALAYLQGHVAAGNVPAEAFLQV